MNKHPVKFNQLFRYPLLRLIRCYQIILSPDHSFWAKRVFPHGYCRYYPSCSEYARQAVKEKGLLLGAVRALWRILRCNPWSRGGVDAP